jgi:hypothetical protein
MIKLIMLKECAATAITNMAVLKSHGIVLMINFMLQVCAKIVILITTIVKSGKKNNVKKMIIKKLKIKVFKKMKTLKIITNDLNIYDMLFFHII